MDPVAIGGLVVSIASLTWQSYMNMRARQDRRNADIVIDKDGQRIVVQVKDLDKPEQAELFVRDILSRQEIVREDTLDGRD